MTVRRSRLSGQFYRFESGATIDPISEVTMKAARSPLGRYLTVNLNSNAVQVAGVETHNGRLIAQGDGMLVVKTQGKTDNPGSPHSGLRTYYPGSIRVFRIVQETEVTGFSVTYEVEGVTSWDTSRNS